MASLYAAWAKHCKERGFTEKIVGDDAYGRTRNVRSEHLKLEGARGGKLQIVQLRWSPEHGCFRAVKRYEVPLEEKEK